MKICPPEHTTEWKDLVAAVGKFEAYRDWGENDYTVRDPQVVREKLESQGFNVADVYTEGPVPPSFDDAFQSNFQGERTVHKVDNLADMGKISGLRKENNKFIIDAAKYPGINMSKSEFQNATRSDIQNKSFASPFYGRNKNEFEVYEKAPLFGSPVWAVRLKEEQRLPGERTPYFGRTFTSKTKANEYINESFARVRNESLRTAINQSFKNKDLLIINNKVFVKQGVNHAFQEFYPFLDYKNPIKIKSRTYYFLTNKFTYDSMANVKNKEQEDIRFAIAAKQGRYGLRPTKRANLTPRIRKQFQDYLDNHGTVQQQVVDTIIKSTQDLNTYINNLEVDPSTYSDPLLRKQAIDNLLAEVTFHVPAQETQFREIFNKLPTVVLLNMNLNFYPGDDLPFPNRINYEMRRGPLHADPLPRTPGSFKPVLATSAMLPDNPAYKFAIDKVNNQIFNNTFVDQFTKAERSIIAAVNRGNVPEHKSKGMAVMLEVYKKNSKLGLKFWIEYKRISAARKADLNYKLRKELSPEGKTKYDDILNKNEVIQTLRAVHEDIMNTEVYDKAFDINVELDHPLEQSTIYTHPVARATGLFVYDMSAYNPLLKEINKMIDEIVQDQTMFNLTGYSARDRFSYVYAAIITGQGPVALKLKTTTFIERILDMVGGIVTWILGRNVQTTAFDVLEQKINNLHEAIAVTKSLEAYNSGHFTIDQLRNEITDLNAQALGREARVAPPRGNSVSDMIKSKVPVHLINKVIKRGVQQDLDLSDHTELPEGLDLSRFNIIHFEYLRKFPQDIKLPNSNAVIYLNQFNRADIPDYIRARFGTSELRTKDWKAPKETVAGEAISKTKSQILTGVKSKYGFPHTATYYNQKTSAFHYTLSLEGQPVTVEFNADTEEFPMGYYKSFNYHGVKGSKPLGWFGGVISDTSKSKYLPAGKLDDFVSGGDHYTIESEGDLMHESVEYFRNHTEISENDYHDAWNRYKDIAQQEGSSSGKKIFTVTEVQSDPLQRTGNLARDIDDINQRDIRDFKQFKSKIENHFSGWYYVFGATGIYTILKNNPDITEVRIPSSAYYQTKHPNAPVYIYDKIASMFKHTTEGSDTVKLNELIKELERTRDQIDHLGAEIERIELIEDRESSTIKSLEAEQRTWFNKLDKLQKDISKFSQWHVIQVKDITGMAPENMMDQYDVIIRSGISAGVKDQLELTPDLASPREIAHDTLGAMLEHDIFKKYFNSDTGKKHLEALNKWIDEYFSDEKPETGTAEGGEGVMVDPEGNEIEGEETEDPLQDLIQKSLIRETRIDIDWLLDELSEAIKKKNAPRANFIKQLLNEQQGNTGTVSYNREVVIVTEYHKDVAETSRREYESQGFTVSDIIQGKDLQGRAIYKFTARPSKLSAFRPLDTQTQKNILSNEALNQLISWLESKFPNLRALRITGEQAASITAKSSNPWNGEPVFFYKGNIYIVGENVTSNMIFHEFAHPIFRSMWNSPNKGTVDLFHKMYDDLAATSEGIRIIDEVTLGYPELVPGTELFKEEVMVRALAQRADDIRNEIKSSPGFLGVINRILYAIKQLLRKLFTQPISPENLDVNTSIDELARMLTNKDFKINTKLVSQEDVTAFYKERNKLADELFGAKLEEKIQPMLQQLYNTTLKEKVRLLENEDLPEMLKLVQDEFDLNLLSDIRKNIYKYKDQIVSKMQAGVEKTKVLNNQVRSLISSLYNLETITKSLSAEMDEIKKGTRTKEDVLRVQTITEFIRYWENFLIGDNGIKQQLLDGGLSPKSDMIQLIDNVVNNIVLTKLHADPIIKEGMEILLTSVLEYQSQKNDKQYQDQLNHLIDIGADKKLIRSYQQEYEKIKMTPGKIKALMSGMSDASLLNNMLEGWLYSSDDVVGGMGVFFKNTHNNIQAEVQKKFTDFVNDIVPLAKEAGLNLGTDVAQFAKRFLFKDKKGVWEDGKLSMHEGWTFLNKHKDYRWKVAELKNKLNEAELKFEKTKDPSDELVLSGLRAEKEKMDAHFWREFTDDFYSKDLIFKTPIGIKAKEQRDEIYFQINELTRTAEKEGDMLDIRPGDTSSPAAQIEQLRKKLRQLYSLKDLNDDYKIDTDDDPALSIAKILQESRALNKDFYTYREKAGMFQKLLNRYEQELVEQGFAPDSKGFNDKRQEWLNYNTVQAVTPEYRERIGELFDRLNAIYRSIPNPPQIALDLINARKELFDILSRYRDDDGQPVGPEMSPDTMVKVKDLQDKINTLDKQIKNTLTAEQTATLEQFEYQLASGDSLTEAQEKYYNILRAKIPGDEGMDEWKRAEAAPIWVEINKLQEKHPTEYYLDVFNNYMEKLPEEIKEQIMAVNRVASMDKDSADYLINLPNDMLKDMLNSVPGFKDWFKANHIVNTVWDPVLEQQKRVWQRLPAWNITRPKDSQYMARTSVYDLDGNISSIEGKPSQRFFERVVKLEYHTEKKIGETVDIFGNFLPRSMAEGAPSDDYINEEYRILQQTDPKLFKVLEAIKERYLKYQEGADRYARLGYDFPMFRKRTSETITSGGNPLSTWWKNTRDFFARAKDDPDNQYNLQNEIDLTNQPYFDVDNDQIIPVSGIYNLPLENVSLDLFHGVAQYMAGLERQKQLKQVLPFFRATHDVLNNPANSIKTTQGVLNRMFNSDNVRASALKNKMEKEFYGITNAGIFKNHKGVNAIVNAAFRGASISYLAWQIPSAIANMTVQIVQNVIRSASGEQFTLAELTRGSIWAGEASVAIAREIYRDEAHSLIVQLTEIFDPIPGRYLQNELGRSQGRSWLRDFASMSWLYSPRKFMENYATLQAFGAMMDHIRVKQSTPAGIKEIKYIDAWELVDNKITLKPGIDPKYGQGGSEFSRILTYMQHVQHDMNGAYDNFSQPEAARYLLYRMYAFLRKYVTTMLTNRFSGTRNVPGMLEARTGFYTSVAKTLWRAITMDPKALTNMTPSEQAAAKQFVTEVGLIALMWFMYGLFDWDPDDPDRYEKLRAKSGPLPLPFVPETEHPFQADGWFSNHGLLQLLKLKAQTEMWVPLPGFGLKDYTSLPSMTPIAIGPTIDLYAKMIDNAVKLTQGDNRAYYQRTVGPYDWQQEGAPKVANYFAKIFGATGTFTAPERAVEKTQQAKVLK